MPTPVEELDPIADEVAETIYSSFVDYHGNFHSITRRARVHFERCEWSLAAADAADRLGLHRRHVITTVTRCQKVLADAGVIDPKTKWREARSIYSQMIDGRSDLELAETFFNSVTRRVFTTIGVDNDLEFRWFGPTTLPRGEARTPLFRTYLPDGPVIDWVRRILTDVADELAAPFVDLEGDIERVAATLEPFLLDAWETIEISGIDTVVPLFFRNKGAYVVGRIRHLNRLTPFVVALLRLPEGVVVDVVLLTEPEASRVFGVTRSYFHVEWNDPAELVGFVKSLLPMKAISELYTAIGYQQHGKTSLYRSLYRHMENSTGKFEPARGTKGMVMVVFSLTSFNVVFKVIKDRFAPPKNTTREQVMGKYRLVYEHDRVGRMVDAQEFENLSFDRDRFTDELLEELAAEASDTVTITDDRVIIGHVYTERQLYPLNLYLREMGPERARAAVVDYGAAIKDLAAANIFPGDLFAKNFGVTRHGSVVFYDYDELCLLSECNFREIPTSDHPDDEMSAEPWYGIGPDDVFPEQFRTFMRFDGELQTLFREHHADLYDVDFWRGMQAQHAEGKMPDFFPYPTDLRFPRSGRV